MKKYRVLKSTIVEGSPVREGQLVTLSDEDAKAYLKSKAVEEVKANADGDGKAAETFDVAPSEKPNMATQTKRVVTESYYEGGEKAEVAPKAPDKKD